MANFAGEMTHVTGLQSAQLGLARLLEGWREQFSAREFGARAS
jgi:hypothetical protein